MRRIMTLALLLGSLVGSVAWVHASEHSAVATAPGNRTARGHIVRIEPNARQLTIRTEDNREMLVVAGITTEIRLNDRSATIASLQAGDLVTVINPRDTAVAQGIYATRTS